MDTESKKCNCLHREDWKDCGSTMQSPEAIIAELPDMRDSLFSAFRKYEVIMKSDKSRRIKTRNTFKGM